MGGPWRRPVKGGGGGRKEEEEEHTSPLMRCLKNNVHGIGYVVKPIKFAQPTEV
jgi:hypothetical protein